MTAGMDSGTCDRQLGNRYSRIILSTAIRASTFVAMLIRYGCCIMRGRRAVEETCIWLGVYECSDIKEVK